MKIVAFLPVKGTSSRVHNKNMQIFNGEPLFVYTLRKLLKCKFIDEVYLDSENHDILEIGRRMGARLLPRDPKLADNNTDGHQLFYNEVAQVEADIYIQHLCTSPFVKESTIRTAVDLLKTDASIDSVVLGQEGKYYRWDNGRPAYNLEHIPNSVDLPWEISEAMALYAVKASAAKTTRRRIGNSPRILIGEPIELIDINFEKDLDLAKVVAAGLLAEEQKRLQVLGRFLSSPILSDICDEMGIKGVLNHGYSSNVPGARLIGRARTLHLREATDSDPSDSIYHALQSYSQVVSNDIIVVKTDLPYLSYFGELNMSISIRSGAIGAIVAGFTRDTRATSEAGFPVFALGSYCKDIKGKGAVQSINQPVELDGVNILPSDLVFADQDGIVIIPRNLEDEVLARALEIMNSEKGIVNDVCKGLDVNSLIKKYGFF